MSTNDISARFRLTGPVRLLVCGEFLSGVGSGTTYPYLVVYLHQVCGMPLQAVGLVLVVRAVWTVVSAGVGGAVCDRLGAWFVMLVSLAMAAVGALMMAATRQPVLAAIAAVVMTGACAALATGLNTMLGTVVPERHRSAAFAWRNTAINLGGGIGAVGASVLIAAVGTGGGLHWLYLIDSVSFLVYLIIVAMRLPGSPVRAGVESQSQIPEIGNGYRAVLADPVMRRICVLTVVVVLAGFAQIEVALPALALSTGTAAGLGWVFATNMIVIVILQIPAQRSLNNHEPRRVLAAAVAVMAGAFGLIAVHPNPHLAVLVMAAALFAVGEMAYLPTITALVNSISSSRLRGRYNGAHTLAWTGGFALGAAAAGLTLATFGPRAVVTLSALLLTLACPLAYLLHRHYPHKEIRDSGKTRDSS